MDVDGSDSVGLELLGSLAEDGVGLLGLPVVHAELAVGVANQDELVTDGDASRLAIIVLPLEGELLAYVRQVDLLGEPVLRSCLGNEALADYLGVLLQVVLGIDSVPPLVPVDEPDHVN